MLHIFKNDLFIQLYNSTQVCCSHLTFNFSHMNIKVDDVLFGFESVSYLEECLLDQ